MHSGAAEPDVRVGVAKNVERVRIIEHVLVEVRGAVEHHNPLTRLDLDSGQFRIDHRGALKGGDRRGPADDLISRGRGALPLVQIPLIRVFGEGDHPVRDRVAGGLTAGDSQHQNEEGKLVVGQFLAVHVGIDQSGDDVVAGILCLQLSHFHGVTQHLHRRCSSVNVGELRILVAGHLIGPAEQLIPVLLRNAEQPGDGLQWQFT